MTLDSGEFVATPLIAQYTALFPEFNWRVGAHQEVILTTIRRQHVAHLEPDKAEFLDNYPDPSVHVWWLTKTASGASPVLPEWSSMCSHMRSPHAILLDELSIASFVGEARRDLRQGFQRLDIEFWRERADQPVFLPQAVDTHHAHNYSLQHAYRTYDEIKVRAARFEVHHFDQLIVPDIIISRACNQQVDAQRIAAGLDPSQRPTDVAPAIVDVVDAIGRGEWRGQKPNTNPVLGNIVDRDSLAFIVGTPADQLEAVLAQLTTDGGIVKLQTHDLYASATWVPAPEFFDIATGDELLALLHPQSVSLVEKNCPQLRQALQIDWDHAAIPRPQTDTDLGGALDW